MQQKQLVCCPYNSQHKMAANRLVFHIARECTERKMNKHMYRHCPYNFLHIYRGEEIEQHLNQCPDKVDQEPAPLIVQQPYEGPELPPGNPDWGLKPMNIEYPEEPKQQQPQQDNQLIDQFKSLNLTKKDDIWDYMWRQQGYNEADDEELDMN